MLAQNGVNPDANSGGNIFGGTATVEAGLPYDTSGTLIGNYMLDVIFTHYTGTIQDSGQGIFNYNSVTRNDKTEHNISLNIGSFSLTRSLTGFSIGLDGYSVGGEFSLSDGWTANYSSTDGSKINEYEFQINPLKIGPAVGSFLYSTAPIWVPYVAAAL